MFCLTQTDLFVIIPYSSRRLYMSTELTVTKSIELIDGLVRGANLPDREMHQTDLGATISFMLKLKPIFEGIEKILEKVESQKKIIGTRFPYYKSGETFVPYYKNQPGMDQASDEEVKSVFKLLIAIYSLLEKEVKKISELTLTEKEGEIAKQIDNEFEELINNVQIAKDCLENEPFKETDFKIATNTGYWDVSDEGRPLAEQMHQILRINTNYKQVADPIMKIVRHLEGLVRIYKD